MRHGVVTIEGDDPVGVAADLMVETALRSLPVVHRRSGGAELVGMVSRGDLLRGLRAELIEAAHAPALGESSVPDTTPGVTRLVRRFPGGHPRASPRTRPGCAAPPARPRRATSRSVRPRSGRSRRTTPTTPAG
ncbi:MAG: CBS domain-containing protein [Gemmatimonadales bacterium]